MSVHTDPSRRPRPATPSPALPTALTAAQRWALELAEPLGWGVVVEAKDGSRLQLRAGYPARALVLYLSPEGAARDEEQAAP